MRWTPLDRDYSSEYTALANAATIKLTKQHPLLGKANQIAFNFDVARQEQQQDEEKAKQEEEKSRPPANGTSAVPLDPLSALLSPSSVASSPLAATSLLSPLHTTMSSPSPVNANTSAVPATSSRPVTYIVSERFEPWSAKRSRILSKYTTTKKIAFSAFSAAADENSTTAIKEVSTTKSRLEELEEQAGVGAGGGAGGEKQQLTAKEYVAQIEELKVKLQQAWDAGERVISLKIAIQCAKMLGDVSTASFYPSMYVLLTDILDSFGDMVFERIKHKGVESYHNSIKVSSALPP